ncbi:MAG: hypothetical protein PUF50_07380 [Erysipelotrichaceae bacterium]|nr:hypothetical protein [Erysipelotrichaceae bacterium]
MELDTPIETSTTEYPESLFDEESTEESSDTPAEENTVEEQQEQPEPTKEEESNQPQTIKVKFNGEVKEIPLDEAITLAQKGMNYDKKVSELDSLKNSRQIKVIERLANQANMSIDEYLDSVELGFENQNIKKISVELKKKYPDSSEELLDELAKSQYALIMQENKIKAEEEARKKEENEKDEQKEQDDKLNEMISEFMKLYPDVDLEKELQNPEFIKLVDQGHSLVSAYQNIDNQRLKAELEAIKKNDKNKSKATGPISGNSESKEEDFFLSGFLD